MHAQGDRLPGWRRAALGAAGDAIVFAVLALVVWTLVPAVALGATPVVISGGSMSPSLRAGDVVLLDDTPPPAGEMFAPDTVITFEATDLAGEPTGDLVTHRVASVSDGHYTTRGDANGGDDPRSVHPDQLVGAGRWLVPFVGLPAHWARTGSWHLVVAAAAVVIGAGTASFGTRRWPADEVVGPSLEVAADPSPAHAAVAAARAARRSLAGTARARETRHDREPAIRRRDRAAGSSGSAPVAGILALALALLGSTVVPDVSGATYVATTTNAGNAFGTASGPGGGDQATSLVLPAHGGQTILTSPSSDGGAGYTWHLDLATTTVVAGRPTVTATVRSNTPGTPPRSIGVTLRVDGQPLATGQATVGTTDGAWISQDVLLSPVATQLPAGTTLEVEVQVVRLDLQVGGPSVITLP